MNGIFRVSKANLNLDRLFYFCFHIHSPNIRGDLDWRFGVGIPVFRHEQLFSHSAPDTTRALALATARRILTTEHAQCGLYSRASIEGEVNTGVGMARGPDEARAALSRMFFRPARHDVCVRTTITVSARRRYGVAIAQAHYRWTRFFLRSDGRQQDLGTPHCHIARKLWQQRIWRDVRAPPLTCFGRVCAFGAMQSCCRMMKKPSR